MRNNTAELIQRILTGDDAAFARLVKKYQKRVHTLAWRKIGDFHIAEDITQETFLQAYRKLATLKDPSQFPGWLYVIANRCCLKWLRKKRVQVQSMEEIDIAMAERSSYSRHVAAEQAESAAETKRELVKNLLAKLKESDRTVITLYYFGEMTYAEIGEFLGVSVNTVATRVHRARERLKKYEPMIREALGSFQLSPDLTENIKGENMFQDVITSTQLTNISPAHSGKVRDLYDLGDQLLIVSTDRISAFDVVLPNGIPDKGKVLTGLSKFWFDYTKSVADNHLITTEVEDYPDILQPDADLLKGRSMLVQKTDRIDVECVVRGYLAGSGWSSYQKTGEICGQKLPDGLQELDRLPELLFTPTTKAEQGEHDEPISIEEMRDEVGSELTDRLITASFALFHAASQHAENAGITLCDTKFEFGQRDGKLIVIDEVFTPDSSRFWPADLYEPGKPQQSFDKQFVRDYLTEIGWNKQLPAPELPQSVISKTSEKYREAYRLIVGEEL